MRIINYIILIIIVLLTSFMNVYTDVEDSKILLFKPFTAAIFEPRIGSIINMSEDNLRLDIGTSLDLYRASDNSGISFSFGGDFFTYTRLRSEKNFKFPVETSDYYFGINSSTDFRIKDLNFASRIRIAHISSHLVDGYSENGVFYKQPFVYSREFVDWALAYKNSNNIIDYRLYGGFYWIFSTTPGDLNDFLPYLGIDFEKKIFKILSISGGIDIKKGEKEFTNFSGQLGLNLKLFKDFGVFFGYYKYFGSSMHGMFYDTKDNYDGIGFQLIYF